VDEEEVFCFDGKGFKTTSLGSHSGEEEEAYAKNRRSQSAKTSPKKYKL